MDKIFKITLLKSLFMGFVSAFIVSFVVLVICIFCVWIMLVPIELYNSGTLPVANNMSEVIDSFFHIWFAFTLFGTQIACIFFFNYYMKKH